MELQIKEPQKQVIEIQNFEDLKTEITESLKKYKDLIYGDEQIAIAKKDRAKLNAFKSALDDKRKEVKKQCLEPYNAFEVQAKELIAMVDEPIKEIDAQIKEYENVRKAEKKEGIKYYFDENIGDLFQVLTFDMIFNEKWLNTTTSMKSIEKDIDEIIQKVTNDLLVIGSYDSEFVPMMRAKYLESLDLAAALKEGMRLDDIKKADEQRKAQEKAKQQEETPAHMETVVETVTSDQVMPGGKWIEEPVFTLAFEVTGTKEQIMALSNFLNANHIVYRRVK